MMKNDGLDATDMQERVSLVKKLYPLSDADETGEALLV